MQAEFKDSRILGIDFGEKRIGLALSDPTKLFAYAYKTIENKENYFTGLSQLINEKQIIKIIIGLPSSRFKASKILAEKVQLLKKKIEDQLNVEVLLWDEDYTSAIAKSKIIESVNKKSKRKDKSNIDSFSAAVILQEYLDSRQHAVIS